MSWFNNLRIAAKLIVCFMVVALISGIVGTVGIYNIHKLNGEYTKLYTEDTLPLAKLGHLQSEFLSLHLIIMRGNLVDSLRRAQYIEEAKNLLKTLETDIEELKAKIETEEEKKDYEEVRTTFAAYKDFTSKYFSLLAVDQREQASSLIMSEGDSASKALGSAIQRMVDLNIRQGKERADLNNTLTYTTTTIMIIVVILAVVVAAGIGVMLSRLIGGQISRIMQAADKIAKGNLDVQLVCNTKDEIGNLAGSLERIKLSLTSLLGDANMLVQSALEGKLDVRADSAKHEGEYQKIVIGINDMLTAVIEPINEARGVLAKMAINDYTLDMKGNYRGLLYEFAEAIRTVRLRVLKIQDIVVTVANGDFTHLDELQKIGRASEQDKMTPAFIAMMTAIRNLVEEVNTIAEAAANGKLEVRGQAASFQGGYRAVISGLNKTLDAIEEPINEAAAVLVEVADGNLCMEMQGEYKGSYKRIKDSLNHSVQSLNAVMSGILEASQQVASGARQVSDGSQALSQGATEQASSIEELTVSVNTVAAQTKDNAGYANQASELATQVKNNAEKGNTHMRDMLNSMQAINESSASISKIIKVIDEIAFQTNILALNAAVEAARAGQHGKGFAVVAEEVRNLAARSANAAKETTGLIEGSIKKVEAGTSIANSTAQALEEIVSGVAKAAELVKEIASASSEQASSIAQINLGVAQVSQVVQTNSATAEESAAASEELSGQADVLRGMVTKFRLEKASATERCQANRQERKITYNNKPKILLGDDEFGKY